MTEKEQNLADSFRKLHKAQEDHAGDKPGTKRYAADQKKLAEQEKSLHKKTESQGERLQEGAEYRELGDAPSPNYLGYSHEALKAMVEGRNDPGQVGTIGSSWTKLGNAFVELGDALVKSVTKSASEWQGTSADKAREFTGQLGNWFNSVAQGAQLAGNRLTAKAQLAADIKNSLPPPVDFSMSDALQQANQQTDPAAQQQAMSQLRENAAAQEAAHRQAAEMVEKYDKALIDYAATMPAFAPPPTMAGSPPPNQNLVTQLDAPQGVNQPDKLDEVQQNQIPGPNSSVPQRDSGTQQQQPTPVKPVDMPTVRPGGVTTPDSSTSQQNFQPMSSTYQPGSFGSGSGFSSGSSYSPSGGGGAGFAAPLQNPGARAGFATPGPERVAPGASTAARTGGPAGRPGAFGGMPMGGQGKGEDDYEHTRPEYLVEPDPNEIFGTDEQTSKPVIGE
ncbi:hypothetical protein JOF56_001271 [Kibdelosporangium banguiense]|uniref:PPE domain-containing protein n=1 Tax=Kibdelosporangium banguiense TaxID=1365924 RepID=A0ABS4T986_9PSEU|nr:hypothetical protein [Kibdelosporangium banguiense]MBP2320886.1 hypothetical protein [Kibdelosporangium banguiense]